MGANIDFTPYEDALHDIMVFGNNKTDRTGTGTRSLFGMTMRFNLREGFPLVTTKKVHIKSIILELLWFLRGETNVKWLQEQGCTIWNEWADENGELGPVYGKQWRSWESGERGVGETIDQIAQVIKGIRENPDSRRHIVSAWNVGDVQDMALPPCHMMFQFYVNNGRLDCMMYQRSCDMFLGVPFNIASYALLTMMIANQCDLEYGEFIWVGGDCHIYKNHFEQVNQQLTRKPYPVPRMLIKPAPDIDSYTLEHFVLENYQHHPAIKGDVAV